MCKFIELETQHRQKFGEEINPFQRANPNKEQSEPKLGEREAFPEATYNACYDGLPLDFSEKDFLPENYIAEVKNSKSYRDYSFLWVINKDPGILMIRETTPNILRGNEKPYVCHTNLTGNSSAFVGGEVYFVRRINTGMVDSHHYEVIINFKSDRYGNLNTIPQSESETIVQGVKEYFELAQYKIHFIVSPVYL